MCNLNRNYFDLFLIIETNFRYAALTSEELEEIEILRKSKQLENCIDYDKK